MISQTAEYALRAVVHLAAFHDAPGRPPEKTAEVAAATKVPAGYLSKVLQSLVHAGLVVGQRGLGGGFRLAKSPAEITIYEVLQAVDPIPRIKSCPLGLEAHAVRLCPLHSRLDEAMELAERAYRETTIAELAEAPLGAYS